MKKIATGSIIVNPSDVQQGSTVDHIIDRGSQLVSQQEVTWDGSNAASAGAMELHLQLAAGAGYAINQLPAGTYTLSSEQALIAYASRTSGTTVLTLGTYSSLTAGQYAIVNVSAIDPIQLQEKDHFIFFRAHAPGSFTQLYIPLNKQVINPGTSQYLGSAPDLGIYSVDLVDPIDATLPTGSSATIDGVAVANGDTVLFTALSSGNNQIYEVSGVGSSLVWTSILTPSNTNQVKVEDGTIYADQIGIFNGSSWSFNDTVRYINSAGNYWEQTAIRSVSISASTTAPIFTVQATSYNNIKVNYSLGNMSDSTSHETGTIYITQNGTVVNVTSEASTIGSPGVTFSAVISSGNLILSYTSSSITGTMNYFTSSWSDSPGGPSGIPVYPAYDTIPSGYLSVAYTNSDGSDIPSNVTSVGVVGGVTQVTLAWTYTVGVNSGTTGSDVEVIANGQVLPRFLASTTTDSYFTEVNNNTIAFWANLTSPAISLEFRRKAGTVDTSTSNGARIKAYYDLIVGSSAQVLSGEADYTTITAAVNYLISISNIQARILVLPGSYTENVNLSSCNEIVIEGKGHSSQINGTLTFNSSYCMVKNMGIVGNITFNSGANSNILDNSWQTAAATVTDNGSSNLYTVTDL